MDTSLLTTFDWINILS